MRSAMSIRPVPSSQTQGPAAASSLMCWGGHRAARSIAHTFTEMDWPGALVSLAARAAGSPAARQSHS